MGRAGTSGGRSFGARCAGKHGGSAQPVCEADLDFAVILCISVLEWFFLLPAWRKFFKGFSALANFHGGTGALQVKRGRTRCEAMSGLSVLFVLLHAALAVLPELTILVSYEVEHGNALFTFDWYQYVMLFRIAAALLSGVVGVIWLVRYARFMRSCVRAGAVVTPL